MVGLLKNPRIAGVLLVVGISTATIASAPAQPATVAAPPLRAHLLARHPLTLVYLGLVLSACRASSANPAAEQKDCCLVPALNLAKEVELTAPPRREQ